MDEELMYHPEDRYWCTMHVLNTCNMICFEERFRVGCFLQYCGGILWNQAYCFPLAHSYLHNIGGYSKILFFERMNRLILVKKRRVRQSLISNKAFVFGQAQLDVWYSEIFCPVIVLNEVEWEFLAKNKQITVSMVHWYLRTTLPGWQNWSIYPVPNFHEQKNTKPLYF